MSARISSGGSSSLSLRSKSWTESETTLLGTPVSTATPETPAQKVELFLKLFRCRESVFPKLWENKTKEKKGYSPACTNEWVRGVCGKPPQGVDYDRNLRHSGKRLTLSFTGTLTPTAERFPRARWSSSPRRLRNLVWVLYGRFGLREECPQRSAALF